MVNINYSTDKDLQNVPIDVSQEFGLVKIFWRIRYKNKYLVVQDSFGLESEIKEDSLKELDTENPNFHMRFIEELVLMLDRKTKKQQMELKRNVCSSLNIKLDRLNDAIYRYKKRIDNNFNELMNEVKAEEYMENEGLLDIELVDDDDLDEDDNDYNYVKKLVQNFRTIPVHHHLHKLKRAYYTLGCKFGFGNAEKWIEIFDIEYARMYRTGR